MLLIGQKKRQRVQQLQFEQCLVQRSADETYAFRQHLRTIGGAIEEYMKRQMIWSW